MGDGERETVAEELLCTVRGDGALELTRELALDAALEVLDKWSEDMSAVGMRLMDGVTGRS
jgi:hypothetical protein